MSKEEIADFYGIDIFLLAFPNDLSYEPSGWNGGIYKRNGGKGELYWSENLIYACNTSVTRSLSVEVDKGKIPSTDMVVEKEEPLITSRIAATSVVLCEYVISDDEYYCAKFVFKNVGFFVTTKNLTQDEFLEIIKSLIL